MKKVKPKIRIPAVIREDNNPLSTFADMLLKEIERRKKEKSNE